MMVFFRLIVMLLLVFFVERLTNHQSFIGADYIHNSHSHLTGILFPIASPCHTPFIIRFFFSFSSYNYRIEAMSLLCIPDSSCDTKARSWSS
jgi:hypothetical protein